MKEIAGSKVRGRFRTTLAAAASITALVLSALVPTAASATVTGSGSASFHYRVHIQDFGWTETTGSVGNGKRLEAVNIDQLGSKPVCLRAHVSEIGWQNWKCTSGVGTQITVGTTGMSLGIEAISVRVPGCTVNGAVHLQNIGQVNYDTYVDTLTMGTVGQSRRLEAFYFRVKC